LVSINQKLNNISQQNNNNEKQASKIESLSKPKLKGIIKELIE